MWKVPLFVASTFGNVYEEILSLKATFYPGWMYLEADFDFSKSEGRKG